MTALPKNKSRGFKTVDVLYLLITVLPLVAGMVIKVLTTPKIDGIQIAGAQKYFCIKMPLQDMWITASQINSWLVMISIFGLCLFITHGISAKGGLKRQLVAEWIVEKTKGLVNENMGEYFSGFAPFIASIMALSAFSSLMSLLGLYPPTSDMNIVAGWAILVFILITHYKLKCGLWYYIKGFFDPIPFFAPFNVIGELANPVSMTFRHYGNVLSGSVISALVAAGLSGLSKLIFGWLTEFPILQIGIPAVLSVYFDVFSGCLQAFIFAMLTMLYISGGVPADDYKLRKENKRRKIKC